jgi:hypothetical protein
VRRLVQVLTPFSGSVVHCPSLMILGPVDLWLGRAAAFLGALDEARRLLGCGVVQMRQFGSCVWTERAERELAAVPMR